MIYEVSQNESYICKKTIKKMMKKRVANHYDYVLKSLKIILNNWGIYTYVVIGLIAVITIFFIDVGRSPQHKLIEAHTIYYSALLFLTSTQFTMRYFFHPADSYHLGQHPIIIYKIRNYAIWHGIVYQSTMWIFLFFILSPLYFYITNQNPVHYIYLYVFTVTFTLATTMFKKESKFFLKLNSGKLYPYIYFILIVVLFIWYVTIFCFADVVFIGVGIVINLLFFTSTYHHGKRNILPTFQFLVDNDQQLNILSGTMAGYYAVNSTGMKKKTLYPYIIRSEKSFFSSQNKKILLARLLYKKMLRTPSYLLAVGLSFVTTCLFLFVIHTYLHLIILLSIFFYVIFLIHKQHIAFFYSQIYSQASHLNFRRDSLALLTVCSVPLLIIITFFYIILH